MLDSVPRHHLRVYTSFGNDLPLRSWRIVDTTGITGEEIYHCLEIGRFWINIQRIDQLDVRYKNLADNLYAVLSEQICNFSPTYIHSYLLLSSPWTAVNFHLDAYENFFWCIKGKKTFHLYDIDAPAIGCQRYLEDICAGADDFIPYASEFDRFSKTYELDAGEMVSWKQHSPHYTVNHDEINVGLGTFHGTREGTRRVLNYVASRYFRERFPLMHGTVRDGDCLTAVRRNTYRFLRRLHFQTEEPKVEFLTDLRLDPTDPAGFRKISDVPILAECNRVPN